MVDDGVISKPELRNFLRKLGNTAPDVELRKQLGLCDGIPPVAEKDEEAADSAREEMSTGRRMLKVEN